jgi:hypothetical protein
LDSRGSCPFLVCLDYSLLFYRDASISSGALSLPSTVHGFCYGKSLCLFVCWDWLICGSLNYRISAVLFLDGPDFVRTSLTPKTNGVY